MRTRGYMPAMLGEHWIYVMAAVNSVVTLTLLYTQAAPIRFGIW